jgi:hypothetical protein
MVQVRVDNLLPPYTLNPANYTLHPTLSVGPDTLLHPDVVKNANRKRPASVIDIVNAL